MARYGENTGRPDESSVAQVEDTSQPRVAEDPFPNLDARVDSLESSRGEPDGIATLDGDGQVPVDQLGNASGGGGGGTPVLLDEGILPAGVTLVSPNFGYVDMGGAVAFFGRLNVDVESDPGQGNEPILPLTITLASGDFSDLYHVVQTVNFLAWVTCSSDGMWAQSTVDGELRLGGIVLAGSVAA